MATAQAKLMAGKRASARDLAIPDVANPDRRAECEADDRLWLETYCGDVFYNPFTRHQLEVIETCGLALKHGIQKCVAAPRGDGKSSIVKYLALKYSLSRQVAFPLIIAATSVKAKHILGSLRQRLASNSETPLSEDYPVECHVARYVHPWPSRARNCTANGQRKIRVEWGADMVILPTWEEEEPLGPILMSLGVTSDSLQGCNIYDRRPDFVMLDDLDSRDSLAAENGLIAGKIEEIIDKTISGMAGQSRRLGQFMLCTITSREAAAFKYSDPKTKPNWSGRRIPAIVEWPTAKDLWKEYIELRHAGQSTFDAEDRPIDPFGREAHQLYVDNQEVMDAGAKLSNPHNYEADPLPDGTPKQISSLQRCYDFIADNGLAAFQTEHQNDPPQEDEAGGSGLVERRIQRQLSGLDRRIVPEGCTLITQGIDIRKTQLHYVVRAWRPDFTGWTIDYGVNSVHGKFNTDEALDTAIAEAIRARINELETDPITDIHGEILPLDMTFIDAGYRTDAVYGVCHELARMGSNAKERGIRPAMGCGKSNGCIQASFGITSKRTKDRNPFDGGFLSKKTVGDQRIWVAMLDTDRWKTFEHDRWLTPPDQPGAMRLFGDPSTDDGIRLSRDSLDHLQYAQQIVAENEVDDVVKGKHVRRWRSISNANHWLDASYMASAAAAMLGSNLMAATAKAASKQAKGGWFASQQGKKR